MRRLEGKTILVAGSGGIGGALARRFDRGEFDLVGVGRAIIAQPDWAKLVQAGRLNELTPFSPSVIAGALQRSDSTTMGEPA